MIDLKFAFRSMIDRSGFDRSDRSFSRIVWPLVETILDRSNRTCFGALKNHRGLLNAVDHRHITKKYLKFDNPIEHNITRFVSLDLTKKQPYPGSPAKHFTLFCAQPKQKLACEILW